MSNEINIEDILNNNGAEWMGEMNRVRYISVRNAKVAIKEIIEAVIDKCADKAPTSFNDNSKNSILNIKKEIDYD